MGNPQNFSIDVTRRCQILLEQLWPSVSNKADGRLLPLNASFLLAISTPMVNLPIERIWKPQKGLAVGHINDAVLDASLAKAVKTDIGQSPVAKAPFYKAGAWRYHYLPKEVALPDLSKQGLPLGVQQALVADGALIEYTPVRQSVSQDAAKGLGSKRVGSGTSTATAKRRKGHPSHGSALLARSKKIGPSWACISCRSR
jgi:hypothetical protein